MDNLVQLSSVVLGLVVGGAFACLPLYGWNIRKFVASSLCIKILMWLPIYAVFVAVILAGPFAGLVLVATIFLVAAIEYIRQVRQMNTTPWQVRGYGLVFSACLLGMIFLFLQLSAGEYAPVITLLCFGSVLSDVCAFFFGNYIKGHVLPSWISSNKSWEGVFGQLIGGVVGVGLAAWVIDVQLAWWLGILIGGASALGDLLNSIAKRRLGIKDWGTTIPGHGGMLDRCSSLSMAFLAVALVYLFGGGVL